MTKKFAKRLQSDFVPDGRALSSKEVAQLRFRRTRSHEVYQCAARTGHDPQSGPIFCGRVAEWVAYTDDGILALCEGRHRPPEGTIEEGV